VDGKVVWTLGLGAPTTQPFRLASVSKVLTAAVIARLVDRKALELDAPVQRYVPSFPDKGAPVTVRLLAGHLGGVRHYGPQDFVQQGRTFRTATEGVSLFAADPLAGPPGRYLYSTYGYTLIAAAVEAVTGRSFLEVLKAEISALGLRCEATDPEGGARWAGGGLEATAMDLVRFAWAHRRGGGYISDATLEVMFAPQVDSLGQPTGVGLGWRVSRDEEGRRFVHHAGNMDGARTVLVFYPDDGVAIAILSNKGGTPGPIEALAQEIARPFLPRR
jgi:serine beta-lactamase-like protein LACTB, mitochondrial